MSNFNRFDFEQQIMSCWNVVTDLKDISTGVIEGDLTKDQIANMLMGARQLYDLRFAKLFEQFEQMVQEQQKNSNDKPWVEV